MSFAASRRTREIEVRVALGAKGSRGVADVFRRPLSHVAVGVAIGCGLVIVTVPVVMVIDATARHVALLLAYAVAMTGVGALACIGPTLRAFRAEPVEAPTADG